MSDVVKAAKDLAWSLYLRDTQEKLNDQFASWDAGHRTCQIILSVPSAARVNAIIAALTAATDDGLHQALGPVVRFIDEIDNGDDKRVAAVKRLRERADEMNDQIRAMKSTTVSVAK